MYVPNYDSTRFRQPHTVTITPRLIRALVGAVRIDSPHEFEHVDQADRADAGDEG
jgi:hypothetical protein